MTASGQLCPCPRWFAVPSCMRLRHSGPATLPAPVREHVSAVFACACVHACARLCMSVQVCAREHTHARALLCARVHTRAMSCNFYLEEVPITSREECLGETAINDLHQEMNTEQQPSISDHHMNVAERLARCCHPLSRSDTMCDTSVICMPCMQ